MDERTITGRECDIKHDGLNSWVNKLEMRMEKIEGKLWWAIALLISNLAVLVFNLVRK